MFLTVLQKMKLKSMLKNSLDVIINHMTHIINISIEKSRPTFPQNFRKLM